MKLCASNIAWQSVHDEAVYRLMEDSWFEGLEIAPSRVFPDRPYEHLQEASKFAAVMKKSWGLSVVSMQSLWYGMTQRIAGSRQEREELRSCTVKALWFADAMDCRNIVFGCPKNRRTEKPEDIPAVEEFIADIAGEAGKLGVVIALEPNPQIYGTNFINTTREAIDFVSRVNLPSLKVNLDFGTIIANGETPAEFAEYLPLINHVHISEPELAPIRMRSEHAKLSGMLKKSGYAGCVSIEMRKREGLSELKEAIEYVRRVFA